MNINVNACPVCGYDGKRKPYDFGDICSCCGTEFGFTDEDTSHEVLRHMWIMGGATWWSSRIALPSDFSPVQQLAGIGYNPTSQEFRALSGRLPSNDGGEFIFPADLVLIKSNKVLPRNNWKNFGTIVVFESKKNLAEVVSYPVSDFTAQKMYHMTDIVTHQKLIKGETCLA